MIPNRIRLFQWIALLCAIASASIGSRCAAQSKTPDRSEGESLLLEMERKLLDAKSLRIRFASEGGLVASKGVFEIAERDLCHLEVEVMANDDPMDKMGLGVIRLTGISDGKSITVRASGTGVIGKLIDEKPELIKDIPKEFNQRNTRSFSRGGLLSINSQIEASTILIPPQGQFKPVVSEKLDGRDALKVEWYTERSVVVAPPGEGRGGCMFCRPGPVAPKAVEATQRMIVQDNSIVWLDATTKLPLKRVSPDGMIEHYHSIEINPKLNPARFVQPTDK